MNWNLILAILFFWLGFGFLGSLWWIARLSRQHRADEVDWVVWALALLGPINLFAAFRAWILNE